MSNRPTTKGSPAQRVREASHDAERARRTWWIFGGVLVAVVVIGLAAVAIARPSGESSSSSGVTVTGTPLPALPPSGADPAVGETLPTVTGQAADGSTVVIGPGTQPEVVMVVAHWCPHCQAEIPRIEAWLEANGTPADVELVTVATANDASRPNHPASDWLAEEGWDVPTLIDDADGTGAKALGTTGYPYFVVVGADGRVVARESGEITIEQWEALLAAARSPSG